MKSISFLHIADLHLDSPFKGLKQLPEKIYKRVQESTFTSFYKLIDLAIFEKVDFVIIAGDIFDLEDRSIRASSRFRKQMERLNEHHIQVYLIHGNHDHLGGEMYQMDWPGNVHVFSSGKVEVKQFYKSSETIASLYGFSYPERAVTENMTYLYQKDEDTNSQYHIGILHGNVEGGTTEHNNYAPFRVTDLVQKEFNYWALGHIHKRQVLLDNPVVIYPGNTQGRHTKELGDKGGYIVNMNAQETSYRFYGTADVIWEVASITISDLPDITSFIDRCLLNMEELRKDRAGILLTIEVMGSGSLHEVLIDTEVIEDCIEAFNEEEETRENFVFITGVKLKTSSVFNRNELARQSNFISDLITFIDGYDDTREATSILFTHPGARKFLEKLSAEEQAEIIKDAENYLLHEINNSLLKSRG